MQVAFINSKGFGGNNATAVVLAPSKVDAMLAAAMARFCRLYSAPRTDRAAAEAYAQRAMLPS